MRDTSRRPIDTTTESFCYEKWDNYTSANRLVYNEINYLSPKYREKYEQCLKVKSKQLFQ